MSTPEQRAEWRALAVGMNGTEEGEIILALLDELAAHEEREERVRELVGEWSSRWDVPAPGVLDMAAKHYRAAAGMLAAALDGDQP